MRSIIRRRRRVALVIPLFLVAGTLGVSSPAVASEPGQSRALASSAPARTTAASTRSPALVVRLLAKLLYRGIRIVRRPATKVVQHWTRQEAINWFCSRWYSYFGNDFDNWRWAATYYFGPRWAWNFCATYWR